MSIKKMGNKFVVTYSRRHPKTKKVIHITRKGIPTMMQAKREYSKLMLEMEKRINESIVPTWASFLPEFYKDLSLRLTKKSQENYTSNLSAHTLSSWGPKQVDKIDRDEITELQKTEVGNRSIDHQRSVLKFIRSAFDFAVRKKYIPHNPSPVIKFKHIDPAKGFLTIDQVKILLTEAKNRNIPWYPIWAGALYTGMRNGELYALTWPKVDLKRKKIKVDQSRNNKDGFKETKSGWTRIVDIAPELLYILQELKLKNEVYVFPRVEKWNKGEQARILREFLSILGLPRMRFHDLRATWCTLMLINGVEPIKLMAMGGWRTLKTMLIYMRMAGIDVDGITEKLSLHNPAHGTLLNFKKE